MNDLPNTLLYLEYFKVGSRQRRGVSAGDDVEFIDVSQHHAATIP